MGGIGREGKMEQGAPRCRGRMESRPQAEETILSFETKRREVKTGDMETIWASVYSLNYKGRYYMENKGSQRDFNSLRKW